MELSREKVMNAILNNKTTEAVEMLEEFHLTEDGTPPHFTSGGKALVKDMLGFASVVAFRGGLDDSLAEALVERTAMTVDIFSFLRLATAAAEIKVDEFNTIPEALNIIPEKVSDALRKNRYTDKIARAIEEMSEDAFKAFLAFMMSGEVKTSHVKFDLPIIRYIYRNEIIPMDLMFAFMGLCLRDAIDEVLPGVIGGVLSDLLLGGLCDDDESGEDGDE